MDETGDSNVLLVARCLLAGLFLWSGVGKIVGYDEAAQFMVQHGTIRLLLPAAIVVEIGGALLLIVGFKVKVATLGLAGFCVVTALLFHANFVDRGQISHFLKNFALAGGLLALYVSGPGRLSFDGDGERDGDV
ncbi:MAG: DoxX family protein [Reyranella sp.]|jgi:putative oxidoreductase|nr:DoxX family protein [Reyranella sp.]